MPSVRLKGARGKVTDKNVWGKIKRLRAILGADYRIVLEKDTLTVEADLDDYELRMKVAKVLAE